MEFRQRIMLCVLRYMGSGRNWWGFVRLRGLGAACLWLLLPAMGSAAEVPHGDVLTFESHVRPILERHCFGCHGETKEENGLDLRSLAALLKGGDSGAAVTPGQADKSLIYAAIIAGEMPPKPKNPVSQADAVVIRLWIEGGAKSGLTAALPPWGSRLEESKRHWAFQPTRQVEDVDRVQVKSPADPPAAEYANPVDRFVSAKLRTLGLQSAPAADKRALVRRAYFDLTGLPPAPEKVEQFANDPSPAAFARLVDELLASPQYGERWGRHWLDVARYADSGGYETDIYFRNAWRYRDYVIKSFNDNKPYDRFVQEQVAGDEIWSDDRSLDGTTQITAEQRQHLEANIGTGFYTVGPQVHESNMDARKRAMNA